MPFNWGNLSQKETEDEHRIGFQALTDEQKMNFFDEYFREETAMAEEVLYLLEKITREDEERKEDEKQKQG